MKILAFIGAISIFATIGMVIWLWRDDDEINLG